MQKTPNKFIKQYCKYAKAIHEPYAKHTHTHHMQKKKTQQVHEEKY